MLNINGHTSAAPRQLIKKPVPLTAMRPGRACMIFNVIVTIVITLVAFVGGMVKGGSLGFNKPD